MDVRTSKRRRESKEYRKLRKALCIGYANQLAERMIRHNGYRTLGFKSQLVQVFALIIFIFIFFQLWLPFYGTFWAWYSAFAKRNSTLAYFRLYQFQIFWFEWEFGFVICLQYLIFDQYLFLYRRCIHPLYCKQTMTGCCPIMLCIMNSLQLHAHTCVMYVQ